MELWPKRAAMRRESITNSTVVRRSGAAYSLARNHRLFRVRGASVRNIFQGQAAGARAEDADGEDHDRHGRGNEREHAVRAVVAQKESDQEAGEDGAEAAPGIDEAHSLRANARGE